MRTIALAVAIVLVCAVSAEDANAKLKKCCSKLTKDDQECVTRFCDFDSISQTNVLNYLSTCTERGDTVGHMWDCASSRKDHSECCKAKGVEGSCLEYCTAHDGVPTNYLNYLTCLENFNEIRDCFKEEIEKH
uniref:DB domain-containing protein n=1 Tax=Panagrellus redivivus TaxID=6233 RepID=A0A7E4V978_PANRE